MKNFLRLSATGAVLAASMSMATAAQAQDTASASAFAEILEAFTLTKTADLDFGAVVLATGSAGTVTLGSDGTLNCDGASGDILCSGTTTVGAFTIAGGTAGKTVRLDFSSIVNLVNDTPTAVTTDDETIVLTGLTTDKTLVAASGTNPAYYSAVLNGGATDTDFTVGGTLNFDGAETVGTYTGSFVVGVDYL